MSDYLCTDEWELAMVPAKERKNPSVKVVTKKVYVVEYFDIYGRRKHKNKLTSHAVDILIFKRQFINKYAPYDKQTFFHYVEVDEENGYHAYGPHERDYKEMKSRYLRFVKYLRRKKESSAQEFSVKEGK